MKNIIVLLCLFSTFIKAQDSVAVSIANWKDDKKAAIVFTFDDWSPGHGSIVYPLFKKYNLPATFFVTLKNKDYSGGFKTMKKAYADGFEIGNHTHNHSDLSKINADELQKEVIDAQAVLRKKVHKKCANTFAFPYGVFTPDVLKLTKSSHIGARTANLSYGRMWDYSLTYGKTDYFQLQTFMARDIHTPNTYSRLTKSAAKQGGMIVFMYHSIFNDKIDDKWFGAISEGLLEAHLKAIKTHEDSVWITTFEKAIMYHKEKKHSTISITKQDDNYKVTINCSLNPNQFFEPVTIRLNGLKPIAIKSKGAKIHFTQSPDGMGTLFKSLPYNSEFIIEL